MTASIDTIGSDAIALVTQSFGASDTKPTIELALDAVCRPRDGETLKESIMRQAGTLAVLAGIAAELATVLGEATGGDPAVLLQRLGLSQAQRHAGGDPE